jgi:sugar/nucleoside kinase (ribokinase family)
MEGSTPAGRLVLVGGVIVDTVVAVEALPARGGDVLGRDFLQAVGGGFNVLAAASRQGMATAYAGRFGSGPLGVQARAALEAEGVELLLPEPLPGETGVCLVMVDAGGERTMVTVEGVEADLGPADLARLEIHPEDTVYLSGYELAYPHAVVLGEWLGTADFEADLVFDPGPLVADLEPALLEAALARAAWLSLSAAEAEALTGAGSPVTAAIACLDRGPRLRGAIVRTGAEGCVLAERDEELMRIAAYPAKAIDTTGAGDAHVGAFLAALARGASPGEACVWGNAAASVVVGRRGPSQAPGREQTAAVIAGTAP